MKNINRYVFENLKCLMTGPFRFFHALQFILLLSVFFTVSLNASDKKPSGGDHLPSIEKKLEDKAPDQKTLENVIIDRRHAKWEISANKIVWAMLIFLLAMFSIKYLGLFLESLSEKFSGARLLIKRVIPVIHILGWSFVIYFIIANIFAPPIETLVAMTASAGIAVGFASQDILKNIFGGVMILFDRPFQTGDKIQVDNFYGEVVHIGLRTVRIVTPDDSLVSIPNNEIVNKSVSNSNSGEFNCQVAAEFYLDPSIDIALLKKMAFRAAVISKYAYLNKPIAVNVKHEIHQGRPFLKLRLKAYVLDIRYEFKFMSDMTETLIKGLVKSGLIKSEEFNELNRQLGRGT